MSRKYFGTDGIRGRVGDFPITPQFVMNLGYAAGRVLAGAEHTPGERSAVLIGKDTRISGYMLESALQAGIVISASHNPFEDNGIKFFSAGGNKLPDNVEYAIEAGLEQPIQIESSDQLGKAKRLDDAVGRYIEFCKGTFPSAMNLRGMKIVVDCAHGATYHIARNVFLELGAEVIAIGVQPDGKNINDGYGATAPKNLQKAVVEQHADLGIALDGDGDRLVMVDAAGVLYDGDQLLYVIARHRQEQGKLRGGVVGTLMTNLAFEHAMQRMAIPFMRARVGDRYVMELLQEQGWQLGGENSGHIICLDKHSTGDGIVSALEVLHALRSNNQTLAEAAGDLRLYPQILINVRVAKGMDCLGHAEVQAAVAQAEQALDGRGRVLLRPSGTEPLLRVRVEGEVKQLVEQSAKLIAEAVRKVVAL